LKPKLQLSRDFSQFKFISHQSLRNQSAINRRAEIFRALCGKYYSGRMGEQPQSGGRPDIGRHGSSLDIIDDVAARLSPQLLSRPVLPLLSLTLITKLTLSRRAA
jgi:hypothetical protein